MKTHSRPSRGSTVRAVRTAGCGVPGGGMDGVDAACSVGTHFAGTDRPLPHCDSPGRPSSGFGSGGSGAKGSGGGTKLRACGGT